MSSIGGPPAGLTARPEQQPASPPFADEQPGLSPQQEAEAVEVSVNSGVRDRIANARSFAPSVRQQTQSEIINMRFLQTHLGNPFSARRIPFPILRDMLKDPMIGMGLFYIKTPLIRSDWSIASPDAQLAAAVDEAFRPIISWLTIKQCGALGYGYQPMCRRWKLGELRSVYRDPHSDDPEADKQVWTSKNIKPLVPDIPYSLPPENCIPKWNERGEFDGFTYSTMPIPNPMLVGMTYSWSSQITPGYYIPPEFALWKVNEIDENFGSIFGSPRIARAHRYWWSYWFRWNLADRSFEAKADPSKIVYYPTDDPDGLDINDQDPNKPIIENVQARALALGQQARSGSTLAIPGDFMKDESGRNTSVRKWEIKYLEGGENFDLLDKTFTQLDMLKWQALFLPGSVFNPGRSQSSGSQGVSKNVSTPIGLYEESQEILSNENDAEINDVMIPQFIAANFPDKVGTPCHKVTRGFGAADTEIVKQLIQLIGQTKGLVLPVDTRQLLREANIPLLTTQQQAKQEEKLAQEAEKMQPPVQNPEKVGMQGYNSGITKTPLGDSVYVQPPQIINLEQSHQDFLKSLPDITPFADQSIRAHSVRLRKMFMDRYKSQLDTFTKHLKDHAPLQLSQPEPNAEEPKEKSPLLPSVATAAATALVAAWFAQQPEDKIKKLMAGVVTKIVGRAGDRELHLASLDKGSFDKEATSEWVGKYVDSSISSIDKTVQKEMIDFLSNELQKTVDTSEIVDDAEAHFIDMPETHAERIARATTRDSYNFGMLSAGRDAGIQQVQAHDASDGDNPDTDPKCVERNGRVYPIDQALNEQEHPNGTLHWSYLSTSNLSLKRVDEMPLELEAMEGSRVAYDPDNETLYVLSDVSEAEASLYLITAGSQLTLK